jgi:hypothetical protein
MHITEAIILIGHGAVASDTPKALVSELKALEAQRRARGLSEMSAREAELDKLIREWPRTRDRSLQMGARNPRREIKGPVERLSSRYGL